MLDTVNIQSLVFSGHGKLPQALLLGLSIEDIGQARNGLRSILPEISFGVKNTRLDPPRAVQLLFSAGGIGKLAGADQAGLLSRPFQQGIVSPQRSRALGDQGRNDPSGWNWSDTDMDALLLVYAEDESTVDRQADDLQKLLGDGWRARIRERARLPLNGREPFGFQDGISRVWLDIGDGKAPPPGVALVPPEEVLIHLMPGGKGVLSVDSVYVAVRKMEQDVKAFWRFWQEQSRNDQEAIWLASKAVGRWPNGMPVSGARPMDEPPVDEKQVLEGLSFENDPRGEDCPLGSHIRRANPRGGLRPDPALSLKLVSTRRIIRRGRVYGPPAPKDYYPKSLEAQVDVSESGAPNNRGLLFLALCSDLAGQFEFIQQTWLNNPKQANLYDEVDPIAPGDEIPGDHGYFSIPRNPIRRRISEIKKWVTIRAGGYFLLPGKGGIEYLAGTGAIG